MQNPYYYLNGDIAGNYYYKIKAIRNCYDNYKSNFSDFIFVIPMRLDIQEDRGTIRIDNVDGDIHYELIRQDMTSGDNITLKIDNNPQFPFYSCVDTSVATSCYLNFTIIKSCFTKV